MKFTQFLLAAFTAAAATASPTDDGEFFSVLLKRQEPGSPAYECHNSCGQAIIQSREGGDDVCEDASFVSNYDSCLACAGPDNFNIWQHYGNTLSAAGEACGFDTEPAGSNDGGDDGSDDGGDDGGDSDDNSSSDDSSPTATDDVSPSETSSSDAEPTGDDDASDEDDGDSPSESGDGSEEPTSGDDSESSSPPADAAGALQAGFVGIAVAAACAGGLFM